MNEYRLPSTAIPLHYDLMLRPDLGDASFVGHVTIDISVVEPTDQIVLNAAELTIQSVSVDQTQVPATGIELDDELQRLTITPGALDVGPHTLSIDFTGILNDKLRGFYRSSWVDEDGNTQYMATTQFEATDARRAFPCWDEPARKATFAIALEVAEDLMAVSCQSVTASTPLGDGYKRVTFAPTPLLSTYLLAFVVGDLEATEPVDVDGVPMRIVHVPGKGPLTDYALGVGAFSLRWLTDYFGSKYPGDKIDLIAIPDFAMGAMENFGCVTFREVLLIVDPDATTQSERERSVDVIAHELAHMWFGDLVTMKWWNGLWLKEAFATFTELKVCDAFRTEWRRWDSFAQSRSGAFAVDALASTRPIEYEVRSPSDAEGMYDVLTYEKGAAVVRMLEQFLGEDQFRAGVRSYLDEHAYANTETDDLWRSLQLAADQPVEEIMTRWIFQGGFPLIDCEADASTLTLSQSRFVYDDSAVGDWELLDVPIVVRYGANGAVHEHRTLLVGERATIELDHAPEWLVANAASTGFYRCRYGDTTRAALLANIEALDPVERFALVDDTWNLLLAQKVDLRALLEVIDAVAPQADFLSADRCLGAISTLSLIAQTQEDTDAVGAFAHRIATTVLTNTQGDESNELVTGLRARAREILGMVANDPATIEWARTTESLNAADQKAGLLITAAHGTDADLERYIEGLAQAPTPQVERRYLDAFAQFPGDAQMDRILALTLDGTIRTQDSPFLLNAALANKTQGSRVWSFITENWAALVDAFPSNAIPRMIQGLPALASQDVRPDPRSFLDAHPIPQGTKRVAQSLERRDNLVRLSESLAGTISAEVGSRR